MYVTYNALLRVRGSIWGLNACLIGKPNVNEWMGRKSAQMFIEAYELEDNKYGF